MPAVGDFHDRRSTFSLAAPGQEEKGRWSLQPPDAKSLSEVRGFFKSQKDNATWGEANRLAVRRTAHQARVHGGVATAADYADTYQNHLTNVISTKGKQIQQQVGEARHAQDGYGRT